MVWIKTVLKSFFLPPGLFFCLILFAFFLQFRKKLIASVLALVAVVGLFLLSTPRVAYFLSRPLEEKILPLANWQGAQAIVILGGGQRKACPEFEGQDSVDPSTLSRLAYGAMLHKKTGLPILVSGGLVLDDRISEAHLMAHALRDLFSAPAKWLEERSQNTSENAEYSSQILKKVGVTHILLVTEAWHMRRAVLSFSPTQLSVIPAPTNFVNPLSQSALLNWLPRAEALAKSSQALHEWLGYIWYRIAIP